MLESLLTLVHFPQSQFKGSYGIGANGTLPTRRISQNWDTALQLLAAFLEVMQNRHQNAVERGGTWGSAIVSQALCCRPSYIHGKGRGEREQDLCSALLLWLCILTPVQMSMSRNAPAWKHWNAIFIAIPLPWYQWHRSYQLLLQPVSQVLMLHTLSVDAKAQGRRNDSLHPQCLQG